jgi:diguanylate cyclase (GGDEF)-like protein
MTSSADDNRLEQLVDLVVELASGNLSVRMETSPTRDTVDAVITGFNLLANELEQVYADLEARVAERTVQLRDAQRELERMALSDSLTGLANRILLADRIEQAMARAERGSLPPSVLLLDLDEFKFINDTLGHSAGDHVLVIVAQRLRSLVRETDTVARLGGDEFAIVLPEASEEFAILVADRALEALQRPIRLDNRDLYVRASIGLRFGLRGQSVEHILRDADTAMYEAKARGKANVQVFEPAMHQVSRDRLRVLSELTTATDRGELTLQFQPIVQLADHVIIGAEALVRWNHPVLGLVPPSAFIGIAEESGRIAELGDWVLRTAVATMRDWLAAIGDADELRMHINVSPSELRRPDLARAVLRTLAEAAVDPCRIALDICESGIMAGDVHGMENLHQLRAAGVRVHIDDFGSGYSSIASLRQVPADGVKLDRNLFAGIVDDAKVRTFVHAILRLVKSAGLTPIAEGVESAAQAYALELLGAKIGQGFHFGEPVASEVFLDELRRQRQPAPPRLEEQR